MCCHFLCRYAHSRLRTHAESVAFFGGGSREQAVRFYLLILINISSGTCNLLNFLEITMIDGGNFEYLSMLKIRVRDFTWVHAGG